jgi:hypothetical protein
MTNALEIYKPETYATMKLVAGSMAASGYFSDSKQVAQAIVKVLAGAELGLGPFASMTGISIIQGKPTLGANLLATLVKNDPRYDYRIEQCDNSACVLIWYENGEAVGTSGFTLEEAKLAGLAGKDNWMKYPSDMNFARAITRGQKRFAPGVGGGAPLYTPDELGAETDKEGNIIEGEVIQRQPVPDPVAKANEMFFDDNGEPEPEAPAPDETEQVKEQVIEALDAEPEPPNGNGDKQPMSASDWRDKVATMLGFNHSRHVLATLRLLGYSQTPHDKDTRIKAYKELQAYRHLRDEKGLDKDDALAALADEDETEAEEV